MGSNRDSRVTSAERLGADVLITFEDGRCALYSAELLSATFAQARDFTGLRESSGFDLDLVDGSEKQGS